MEIEFSGHALKRMKERNVSEKEVQETIEDPDKAGKKDDTIVSMKLRKNGHLLIVIHTKNKSPSKVITVIDTSKVNKYL